eukprot:scaffold4571_cov202-Prasinococcus_capsulatus_cf.AAC.1
MKALDQIRSKNFCSKKLVSTTWSFRHALEHALPPNGGRVLFDDMIQLRGRAGNDGGRKKHET